MTAPAGRRPGPATPVSRPHPVLWTLAALVIASGAIGAHTLAQPSGTALLQRASFDVLQAELTAPVLEVAAAVAALAALLAIRRSLYARLARLPGPVEIVSFLEDATGPRVSRVGVLADFRQTLTTMSLASPEPVPSAPRFDGFLDEVRTAFDGDRSSIASAGLLLVALIRVRHAYRVSVQLRTRPGPQACGMSVFVARLPSGRGEVHTVWAENWRSAAEKGGHLVGAYVLPRSRLARRAPWRSWHGQEMSLSLFDRSQKAANHVRAREYDEALRALHDALEEDPQNPFLRIELGQVQEQLGLFMDAAASYADVIAVESWYDRRLWRRLRLLLEDDTTGRPPLRRSRSPHGSEALLIARFRLVTRLADAEQFVLQWRRGLMGEESASAPAPPAASKSTLRAAERRALRVRLRRWLESYVRRYLREVEGEVSTASRYELFQQISEDPEPTRFRQLVQFVAHAEGEYLVDDYRWTRGRRRPNLPITQTALSLARLYLDLAAAQCHERGAAWPVTPAKLDQQISRCLRKKPAMLRGWSEYYNAACITSIALHGWQGSERDVRRARTRLELQAVRHLERAVNSTTSGQVGRYAQWFATGDQDLNPLRQSETFVDFLDRYFPNAEPRIVRPGRLLLPLVMAYHTTRLLSRFCAQREEYWAAAQPASASGDTEIDEQTRQARHVAWCQIRDRERGLDHIAQKLVQRYVEHDRHWPVRVELIAAAEEFASRTGEPMILTALPLFGEDPEVRKIAQRSDAVDVEKSVKLIRHVVRTRRDRLDAVLGTAMSSDASADSDDAAPRTDVPDHEREAYWGALRQGLVADIPWLEDEDTPGTHPVPHE